MNNLALCGGDTALDFANTLGGALEGRWDDEWLLGYGDLVAWGRHAGVLDEPIGRVLLARAAECPRAAAAAHEDALALRESIYAAASAVARGARPPADALAAVADAHRDALSHAGLTPARTTWPGGPESLDWTWEAADHLRRPLWPVAQAAVDLLRSDELSRLKQCGHCRWLFLDASRNHSRRWCSMAHCGTDAKVRLLRARRHEARRRRSRGE